MKLSNNDKMLLALLPSLLVVVAYIVFCFRPMLKTMRGLKASLRSFGSEEQLLVRRSQLNASQTRLREKLAALEAKEATKSRGQVVPFEETASSLRRLQELLHRNGIRVVNAQSEGSRTHSRENRSQQLLAQLGVPQPKAWTVMVEAPYKAMTGLLDDCRTNRFPVLTEALSMRQGAGEGKPTYWTVTICL